eukprot:7867906-Prorocentrum_lima.AAC.1
MISHWCVRAGTYTLSPDCGYAGQPKVSLCDAALASRNFVLELDAGPRDLVLDQSGGYVTLILVSAQL